MADDAVHAMMRRWPVPTLVALAAVAALLTTAAALAAQRPARHRAAHLSSRPFDPARNPRLAQAIARGKRRQSELRSPSARRARRASRTRYKGADGRRAIALARKTFNRELASKLFDGREVLKDHRVVRRLGDRATLVTEPNGKRSVLQGTAPVLAGDGDTALPTDLSLEAEGSGFVPHRPLAPASFPRSLDEGIRVGSGQRTVELTVPGSSVDATEQTDRVFYSDVATDTDFVAQPTVTGIETFFQLRSASSPETVALDVDVPDGAVLRRARSDHPIPGDPPRALEVVKGNDRIATLQAPLAYDADGTPVAADYKLHGRRVEIEVKHAGADLKYPVLVDPTLAYWYTAGCTWPGWGAYSYWGFKPNGIFGNATCDPAYASGLYLSMPTHTYFPANSWAEFAYTAPPDIFMYRGTLGDWGFSPFFTYAGNGITNAANNAWQSPVTYRNGWGGTGGNPWAGDGSYAVSGAYHDYCFDYGDHSCPVNYAAEDRNHLVFYLSTCNGCAPYMGDYKSYTYVNYAYQYLGDRYAPYWTAGVPGNEGWSTASSRTRSVVANDRGLGMERISLYGPPSGGGTQWAGCGSRTPYGAYCDGQQTAWFTYTRNQGINRLRLEAGDLNGLRAGDINWTERADWTSPGMSVSGALKDMETEWQSGDASLTVSATDGVRGGGDAAERSGVKTVQVFVDGQALTVDGQGANTSPTQTCTGDSCPLSGTFTWHPPDGGRLSHHVRVEVADYAGNPLTTKDWDIKTEDEPPVPDLSGSLVDRGSNPLSGSSYGLHVESADGDEDVSGSGVSSIEVLVDGVSKQKVTTNCGSAPNCPGTLDFQFDTATYGAGDHEVLVVITDRAGNQDRQVLEVNVDPAPGLAPETLDIGAADVASETANGLLAGDRAGASVASLGDINGDDVPDYAIGAPGADVTPVGDPLGVPRLNAGKVYVVYGRPNGGTTDLQQVEDGNGGFVIVGADSNSFAGTAVASAGDVNGDGSTDLLIGAPASDGTALGSGTRSRVYLVFSPDGDDTRLDLASIGSRGYEIQGPVPSPLQAGGANSRTFGSWLGDVEAGPHLTTGDINGDNRDDVVVGSSLEDRNGVDSGTAYVVYGKASTTAVSAETMAASEGFRVDGSAAGELAGYAAAFVGDVDNDGFSDLSITAPGRNASGRSDAGSAFLLFGANSTGNLTTSTLGTRGQVVEGQSGDAVGSSVAALGETNDDDYSDYVVGGRNSYVIRGNEERIVPDTAAMTPASGYRIAGPGNAGQAQAAGGGDIDDDGWPDLALGYPESDSGRGAVFALVSPAEGAPAVDLANLPAERGARVNGQDAGDHYGSGVELFEPTGSTDRKVLYAGAPDRDGGTTASPAPDQGKASGVDGGRMTLGRRTTGRKNPCWKRRTVSYNWTPPVDLVPRVTACRRTSRKMLDKAEKGEVRRGAFVDHVKGTARKPLYDSFGQIIAYLQNGKRPGIFKVFDAAGNDVGTTQSPVRQPSDPDVRDTWRIVLNGDACQATRPSGANKSDTSARTLVVLRQAQFEQLDKPTSRYISGEKVFKEDTRGFVPNNDLDTTKNKNLALRGFIQKSDLPTIRRFGTGTQGAQRQAAFLWGYSRCGNRKKNEKLAATATRGFRVAAWATNINKSRSAVTDLYQGDNVLGKAGSDRRPATSCRKAQKFGAEASCGGLYAYYFRPYFAQPDTSGSKVLALTSGTTGVSGGGIVRGLIKIDGSQAAQAGASNLFTEKDSIVYFDRNVPCGNRERARWYWGKVNLSGRPLYGWYPESFESQPGITGSPATSRACPIDVNGNGQDDPEDNEQDPPAGDPIGP